MAHHAVGYVGHFVGNGQVVSGLDAAVLIGSNALEDVTEGSAEPLVLRLREQPTREHAPHSAGLVCGLLNCAVRRMSLRSYFIPDSPGQDNVVLLCRYRWLRAGNELRLPVSYEADQLGERERVIYVAQPDMEDRT